MYYYIYMYFIVINVFDKLATVVGITKTIIVKYALDEDLVGAGMVRINQQCVKIRSVDFRSWKC